MLQNLIKKEQGKFSEAAVVKYRILAPTGALEEGILSLRASVRQSICDFMLRMALKEILKHSKESRGVLGQASRQAIKGDSVGAMPVC